MELRRLKPVTSASPNMDAVTALDDYQIKSNQIYLQAPNMRKKADDK